MQECSRVSGAFDCAYPASNGGIKDYGSRSSEVSYQKTDLEIRWLSGVETSRIDATVTNRKERKEIECRIPTVSAPLDLRLEGFPFDEIRWLSGVETNRIDATVTNRKERKEIECRIPTVSAPLDLRLEGFPFDEIRWLSGVETNRIDATVTNRKERKEIECRIPTVSAPLDLRLEGFPFDEIRWLSGSDSPDGNRDRNESSRIKRMDCGMSLQVELFLLQDSWNNHSSNGLPIHGVITN